jgi:hypothetical protein
MRSPRRPLTGTYSWGKLPSLFPVLGLATGLDPLATTVKILRHVCTYLNSQAKVEQLKLNKTDPSTWS